MAAVRSSFGSRSGYSLAGERQPEGGKRRGVAAPNPHPVHHACSPSPGDAPWLLPGAPPAAGAGKVVRERRTAAQSRASAFEPAWRGAGAAPLALELASRRRGSPLRGGGGQISSSWHPEPACRRHDSPLRGVVAEAAPPGAPSRTREGEINGR
ncbi:hypothetical protein PVAP13_3NG141379 [Panicum virgatum]|uniref:Uncharacterized protein n=1 Tax=Panicum virgatum TaxID=38727 RepID=A0A8T0U430_PANVG|nr:hypothetical protein PVAP13_3NG141379 [Panicum virgatum]